MIDNHYGVFKIKNTYTVNYVKNTLDISLSTKTLNLGRLLKCSSSSSYSQIVTYNIVNTQNPKQKSSFELSNLWAIQPTAGGIGIISQGNGQWFFSIQYKE